MKSIDFRGPDAGIKTWKTRPNKKKRESQVFRSCILERSCITYLLYVMYMFYCTALCCAVYCQQNALTRRLSLLEQTASNILPISFCCGQNKMDKFPHRKNVPDAPRVSEARSPKNFHIFFVYIHHSNTTNSMRICAHQRIFRAPIVILVSYQTL